MTASAPVRRGPFTTEFWASTVAPIVLTAATFIWHRDFSGYVQAAALLATGLSVAAYAISRAHLKRPTSVANVVFDVQALIPAVKQAVEDALRVRGALAKKAVAPAKAAAPVVPPAAP
jgi:hypothetical protein